MGPAGILSIPYHPERFWRPSGLLNIPPALIAGRIASFITLTAARPHSPRFFLARGSAPPATATGRPAHAARFCKRRAGILTAQSFVGTLHYRNPADGYHVREGLLQAGAAGLWTFWFGQFTRRSRNRGRNAGNVAAVIYGVVRAHAGVPSAC